MHLRIFSIQNSSTCEKFRNSVHEVVEDDDSHKVTINLQKLREITIELQKFNEIDHQIIYHKMNLTENKT